MAKPASYKFGLWTLVALVVGNAIGAGIYTTSGYSLQSLGSREWVLLAWLVAGVIALCGALSYGMLAKHFRESGGEYLYLSRTIHPAAGFVAGWISLLAGFPGAIAFSASAFESYLRAAGTNLAAIPQDVIAVSVVIVGGLIHFFKIKAGAKLHEWIVAIMLAALLIALAWSGVEYFVRPDLPSNSGTQSSPFNLLAFANSLVWISLSYSGFNAAAYVAGEVRDPNRDIVRGMLIGTVLTMLLCLLLNAVILYSVPVEKISGQAEVAAIAAEAISGETGRWIIEIIIAISLLTSITAMAMAGPRVYAKMAEDGALPKIFKAENGVPPRASIVLQVAVSMVLILSADIEDMLSYLGLTLSLCLALAVSSLFVQHYRDAVKPDSSWYPLAPAIFVGCTVVFAVLTAINNVHQLYAAVPTICAGLVAYFVSQKLYSAK